MFLFCVLFEWCCFCLASLHLPFETTPSPNSSPFPGGSGRDHSLSCARGRRGQDYCSRVHVEEVERKCSRRGWGGGARAVRAGLVLLRDHLEMNLPMSGVDVRTSGISALVKSKGQATPASPGNLHALGKLASSSNKVASFFGLGVVAILRGGIRHEHSRQSRLESFDAAGAWFH